MKKILIVDDEKWVIEVLKDILEENGYSIIVAMDAMQAIMQTVRNQPDLILLDVMLPAGGGIAVYNRLKQSVITQIIPVIFLTAIPIPSVKQKLPPGAANVIMFSKPWNHKELLGMIDTLLCKKPKVPYPQ